MIMLPHIRVLIGVSSLDSVEDLRSYAYSTRAAATKAMVYVPPDESAAIDSLLGDL